MSEMWSNLQSLAATNAAVVVWPRLCVCVCVCNAVTFESLDLGSLVLKRR